MKQTVSLFLALAMALILCVSLTGCTDLELETTDSEKQQTVQQTLSNNRATRTDIDYSLERYNLIKRAYWVNGQREKAMTLPCPVEKPLGYIILFSDNGAVIGRHVVDGKVTSLNSYLSPDSEYFEISSEYTHYNYWLADVDGSYGEKGFVTNHSVLERVRFDQISCCGPKPMMMAVARYAAKNDIFCEVSLENMMACGLGACLCCVEKTVSGNLCVCKEGPVFNIKKLLWQV